jgi:hypothetical protein
MQARKREWKILGLSVASAVAIGLGALCVPERLVLVALLATFGNLIGLVLLSPMGAGPRKPESRPRSQPWN